MTPHDPRRVVVGLFLAGLLWHAGWALTEPFPHDLDAQYYLTVARNIAEGRGPVTQSLWNLSILPASLPLAADLHWMPLPSRVLVPGLLLWPAHGHQLVSVLLAACWGPLAWTLGRREGLAAPDALLAGLLATIGGVYLRYASAPDCYALYGALGGLGLLGVARGSAAAVAGVAALAALTRNDGLLLGPLLAVGLVGRQRLVALVGPLVGLGWMLRNAGLAGEDWWRARWMASATTDYLVLFNGELVEPLTLAGRATALIQATPELLGFWLTPGLLLLTGPILWAAWAWRDRGWVRALLALTFVLPPLTVLAAPAMALHGTLYRTGAALLGGHLVLAAVGLRALADLGSEHRELDRRFVIGLLAGAWATIAVALGVVHTLAPERPSECPAVEALPVGEPVFTSRPLEMELACARPGVMLTRTTSAERAQEVAQRYGVRFAAVSDDRWLDEGSVAARHVQRKLPGWEEVGPGLWGEVGP